MSTGEGQGNAMPFVCPARTEQHMPAVLRVPCLALNLDVKMRALEETCRLADKDVCQGLTLCNQCELVRVRFDMVGIYTHLLLCPQLRSAVGWVRNLRINCTDTRGRSTGHPGSERIYAPFPSFSTTVTMMLT